MGRSRQKREGVDVAWPDDGEVPTVECRDRVLRESLGCSDDGSIDSTQRQVVVFVYQLGDAKPVGGGNCLHPEITAGEVAEKPDFSVGAKAGADEVDDFGDDERGDEQRLGVFQQEGEALLMMTVVGVDIRVEGTGIDYECDRETSLAKISSMRSEMSERPLRPAPAAPSLRRGPR